MAPLCVGTVATLLARPGTAATRVGLAVMFCFTAAAHFDSMPADLVRMVPPMIPNPEFMVSFTGICEILGAIGLLVPCSGQPSA